MIPSIVTKVFRRLINLINIHLNVFVINSDLAAFNFIRIKYIIMNE